MGTGASTAESVEPGVQSGLQQAEATLHLNKSYPMEINRL